jgi:glycosidase
MSRFWVREFDVDGYRVDVAWGVQERAPDFWPRWRRELKALKPDLLLIAEASARDPRYVGHGFDAAYDWTDELGQWAWQGVFDDAAGLTSRLHAALTNDGRGYPEGARVLRFLANNDTGPRFAAVHPRGLTRVAAALLLTLPGIPCLFTGDERALAYEPYDGGGPLEWSGDEELRGWWRRLIALRREVPALRAAGWRPVDVDGSDGVYAYLRSGPGGTALVVLNVAPDAADVEVAVDDAFTAADGSLVDLLGGAGATVGADGRLAMHAAPHGAAVLVRPTAPTTGATEG